MTDEEAQEPTVTSGEVVSEPDVSGEWLSPPAAADRLGMSERTLWRLVKQGRYQKRTVNRRAEILVPATVTGATGKNTGNTPAVPDRAPDMLALAIIEELRDQRQHDAETIRQKDARIIEVERENAMLKERLTPWRTRLKRWLTGE
jgi:predicted DNA-binding protein (UPF0251 family)